MTFSMALQGASSTFSFNSRWAYDVFLSFRGEDVRHNFLSHLYDALRRKGINTYIDNNLERGERISSALLKAIEGSRISIIILSKNYASSTWCLDELMKILECKETKQQMILPVFYKVDPSIVRKQKESYGEALSNYEHNLNDEMRVERWKAVLKEVSHLSGFHLEKDGNESELIHEIIHLVDSRIRNHTYLEVANYPTGMESRVQHIYSLLSIEKNDIVHMVGIFGVGGIGKTTIAKAVYNMISSKFEGSCFLKNIRETSKRERGMVQLQEKLLSDILGASRGCNIDLVDRGTNVIKDRLRSKRILLILDDVDEWGQLKVLARECDWFGLGSRIIITTRDQNLLTNHDVEARYELERFNHDEAFKLFSLCAFKRERPLENYVELTERIIGYAGGLPLALEVLGSDLHGRSLQEWESALDEYKRIPHEKIQKILRMSFDGLRESEKNIFLDIACFFKGFRKDYVIKILDSCGFCPNIGVKKLKDKCLITIDDYNHFGMHDLLQDMGREIVREESPREPGERSRLWFHEDIRHVLEENTNFQNLTKMELTGSKILTKVPDLSRTPNLKILCLSYCTNLVEVDASVGSLPMLVDLSFHGCCNLTNLPTSLELTSLQILDLAFTNIIELPPSFGNLSRLENLVLIGCKNLLHLPSGILRLQHLQHLGLGLTSSPDMSSEESSNSNIINFDCSSIDLPELRFLGLQHRHGLSNSDFLMRVMRRDGFSTLAVLRLSGSDIISLPENINKLVELTFLDLKNCKQLQQIPALPPNIMGVYAGGCMSLESFPDVSKKFQSTASHLRHLGWIDLSGCHKMNVDIGNFVENTILCEGYPKYLLGLIIFPGNKIPDWFSHTKQNSKNWTPDPLNDLKEFSERTSLDLIPSHCEINLNGLQNGKEIRVILLCAIFEPIPAIYHKDGVEVLDTVLKFQISSNGVELDCRDRDFAFVDLDGDHVWLEYIFLEYLKLENDNLQFTFSSYGRPVFFKSCGVHLVYKNEEKGKDHPGVLHEELDDDEPDENEDSLDLMDGTRLSKRPRRA
ncbi:hypothetical protein I3842_15G097800 [Carya illinoinensis]|uniref:TIR domain-containing protein n=1 Tax=Carya illinoinensis TaxID=32201 RepID=A0A922D225_CARIL|nr:hypothetical protein I3842_15G097800 [Carya illinoinensis]